jgi:hypothetical protein
VKEEFPLNQEEIKCSESIRDDWTVTEKLRKEFSFKLSAYMDL